MTVMTATAPLRRAFPAQRTSTGRRDALATPWSDVALPSPSRLPKATGFPSLALIELSRLR